MKVENSTCDELNVSFLNIDVDVLICIILSMLEEMFNDARWMVISNFVYELDFGKKWREHGGSIELSDSSKLYDYLILNYN